MTALVLAGEPDLASYDWILANSSAGKDSQAMLDVLVERCDAGGVARSRIIVVHADLGRVEWPGTRELAAEHAEHYGLAFEVVRNRNWGDLLERIESRGKWPDRGNRYCTSEFKTGQVSRVMTRLARETPTNGRARILNVLGLRAEESPERAKKPPFSVDAATNKTRRLVHRWLPIHAWSVDEVWARNRQAGTRHHYAYDLGMPRLSCCFCVFASPGALTIAAKANPELARDYAEAEKRMGHTFRNGFSIADVVDAAARDDAVVADDWQA